MILLILREGGRAYSAAREYQIATNDNYVFDRIHASDLRKVKVHASRVKLCERSIYENHVKRPRQAVEGGTLVLGTASSAQTDHRMADEEEKRTLIETRDSNDDFWTDTYTGENVSHGALK